MLIAFWIVSGLVALAALGAGTFKLVRTKAGLAGARMGWVEDFSPLQLKLIGAAEVIGAVGVVVPAATGIAPIVSPIAAVCLCLLWIGATVTHVRRKEPFVPALVPALLAAASAVLGFVLFV